MLAKDIMTRRTHFIRKDASLSEAACLMRDKDVGFLPVRDGGQVVGVVTDRDLALRTHGAPDENPKSIGEVMSKSAFAVDQETPAVNLAGAMKRKRVRRLLVLDGESQLVGVVSVEDLASRTPNPALASDVLGELAPMPGTRTSAVAAGRG
jgi:CBS domain-containing protein